MNYSLSTVRRGFRNLFDKRLTDLEASKAGSYFKDQLHSLHVDISDLPDAIAGVQFKDEMRVVDERHDRLGKTIYLITELCLVHPDIDGAIVDAAKQVREAFVPSLDELKAPYATQGERAADRRALLSTLETQLKMFSLPWDSTKTLYDVAMAFLDEGDKLDELLHQRANEPKALRTQAGILRAKAVGALNRLRKDLAQEIEQNQALPRDLVHKVFGFFDTLHSMEASGRGHEKVAGEEDETTEPAGQTQGG